MKNAVLTPQQEKVSDINLYRVGGRLVAVKPGEKKAPRIEKEIGPEKRFLGTVTTDSGKLTVADPYAFGVSDEEITILPGIGEGTYEVYGLIQEVPGHGPCITKLEIDFIPSWELDERNRLDAKGG